MANHDGEHVEEFWYRGKMTRRRWLGLSAAAAGALGSGMLVPAPWRDAFGQAKPYKIGSLQPLSGAAAAGGKTALVGSQMAVDRINVNADAVTHHIVRIGGKHAVANENSHI